MKRIETEVTNENIYQSLVEDTINRNSEVFNFVRFLDSIEGNYIISIDGNWGSGKTFFAKQVKCIIDAQNEFLGEANSEIKEIIQGEKFAANVRGGCKNMVTFYYDAWANDNDADPLLSIIYSLVNDNEGIFFDNRDRNNTDIITGIISCIPGLSGVKDAWEFINGENLLEAIKKEKELKRKVDEFLNLIIAERGERLVVFIDELDRCSPQFAIKLLERIKHFFTDERITVVYTINKMQLQYVIKNNYGEGFDASRYLDRFFDIQMRLPEIDKDDFIRQFGDEDKDYLINVVINALVTIFGFEMREITRLIPLVYSCVGKKKNSNPLLEQRESNSMFTCKYFIVPLAISLMLYDVQEYNEFMNGSGVDWFIRLCKDENIGCTINRLVVEKNAPLLDSGTGEVINMEKIYEDVYDAVFNTDYMKGTTNQKKIGNSVFNMSNKESVVNGLNFLRTNVIYDS